MARERRHIRMIEVSPELILDMLDVGSGRFQAGHWTYYCGDKIPESAQALRVGVNDFGNVVMLVEDESFEPVGEGAKIPRLEVMYRAEFAQDPPTTQEGQATDLIGT